MQTSTNKLRRRIFGVVGTGALGVLVAGTIALPTAAAQPQCTAASLSTALGTVSTATGAFLASHPGANDVVTNAGAMPGAQGENAIRSYFVPHRGEGSEPKAMAQPLRALRQQCNVDVAPADIARLFDAMA